MRLEGRALSRPCPYVLHTKGCFECLLHGADGAAPSRSVLSCSYLSRRRADKPALSTAPPSIPPYGHTATPPHRHTALPPYAHGTGLEGRASARRSVLAKAAPPATRREAARGRGRVHTHFTRKDASSAFCTAPTERRPPGPFFRVHICPEGALTSPRCPPPHRHTALRPHRPTAIRPYGPTAIRVRNGIGGPRSVAAVSMRTSHGWSPGIRGVADDPGPSRPLDARTDPVYNLDVGADRTSSPAPT